MIAAAAYIIIGPSQTGKSSFVNMIAGNKIAEVGSGNGISVTSGFQQYHIEFSPLLLTSLILIDVQGFDDSKVTTSNEEIKEMMQMAMLNNEEKIKGIIITESIAGDSMRLYSTLKALYEISGSQVKESIIVLATKSDMLEFYDSKYKEIEKICRENNLQYLKWSSNIDSKSDLSSQSTKLLEAMKNISPFNPKWLKELEREI